MKEELKKLYRYTDKSAEVVVDWNGKMELISMEPEVYKVRKVTKCGAWIYRRNTLNTNDKGRFVNLNRDGSFAHATKLKAIESYIIRKNKQERMLRHRLELCRLLKSEAEKIAQGLL